MPETDWLQVNDFRDYPFVDATATLEDMPPSSSSSASPMGPALPRLGFADAGFILGLDAHFEVGVHKVFLYSITRDGFAIAFRFRSDAPQLACYEWVFIFDDDMVAGTTQEINATRTDTGAEAPDKGFGFLTIGNLEELNALPLDELFPDTQPQVEPALLQSLARTFVRKVEIGNEIRPCPQGCECPEESSSSSSSSSESAAPAPDPDACIDLPPPEPDVDPDEATPPIAVETGSFVDDVKLVPGYNSTISLFEDSGTILLGASVGAGKGEPCKDVRHDADNELIESECLSCALPVFMISGQGGPVDHFQMTGGPGILIEPDPEKPHTLIVEFEEESFCNPNL
jgi:hypothetical protein